MVRRGKFIILEVEGIGAIETGELFGGMEEIEIGLAEGALFGDDCFLEGIQGRNRGDRGD